MATSSDSVITDTDVLIVGYGPAGAAVAALLGRYGIQALVIDRAEGILTIPRAVGMDYEGLRIVQMAGLGDDAFETYSVNKTRMMSEYLGEYAAFDMSGVVNGHARQVMYFQPELEQALRDVVDTHASVTVWPNTELLSLREVGDGVLVTVKQQGTATRQIRAKYVVGADGASSTVRKALGIPFGGKTYAENWLIVDAKNMSQMNDHIDFYCGADRPGPHLPGARDRQRWEFMLNDDDDPKEMEKPERIKALLAPWGNADEMEIERQAVYQFHARSCDRYSKGRTFLVGDAAHITPPFLGQGLVSGLRDAANISWKLAWVLKYGAAPRILDTYDEERRPHAVHMIRLAKFLGIFIRPASPLKAKLAHGAVRAIRMIPPVKDYVDSAKLKPEHHFASGLFSKKPRRKSRACAGKKAGELFPQALVRDANGEIRLSDEVLGAQLSIVGLGVDPYDHMSQREVARWRQWGGNIVKISQRNQHLDTQQHMVEDMSGDFIPDAAHFGRVHIVRPDRTVMVEGPANELSRMLVTAETLLGQGCPTKTLIQKLYGKVA